MWYWLDEENLVVHPCNTEEERQLGRSQIGKRVAKDHVKDILISTVFISLDHSMGRGNSIKVFETMAFASGTYDDIECNRYSTWAEALLGHQEMVTRLNQRFEATQ